MDGDGGAEGPFAEGGDGTRMTAEISAGADSAAVPFLTTIGRAPGLGGGIMRSVFAVAGSLAAPPAGFTLDVGRKTDATGFGLSFSLSLEPRTFTEEPGSTGLGDR